MSANAQRVVWYLLWKGGKWYLRQRLPSARALALRGAIAGGALTAVALAVRRARA